MSVVPGALHPIKSVQGMLTFLEEIESTSSTGIAPWYVIALGRGQARGELPGKSTISQTQAWVIYTKLVIAFLDVQYIDILLGLLTGTSAHQFVLFTRWNGE